MPNETNRAMSSTSNSEGNKKEEKGKHKVQPSLDHFNFTNIKKVKGNNVGTNDYFSVGTREYKNIKSTYYFWVVPQFKYVNYSYKNQRSELAPLLSYKVVDSTFLVSFFQTFFKFDANPILTGK